MSARTNLLRTMTIGGAALVLAGSLAVAQEETDPAMPKKSQTKATIGVGKAAPAFELRDTDGKMHTLKAHRGSVIVLEWFNPTCEEVRHQHLSGPLKSLAREFEKDGVVWLGVNSTPKGRDGSGLDATNKAKSELGIKFPILIDEAGTVAEMYRVKRTPTVFVIDDEGVVQYFGAVDNAPKGKLPADGTMVNYLRDALRSVLYGSELTTTKTEAYGCSIRSPMVKVDD